MRTNQRYVSIDFLRGGSIFIMYILHIINNLMDFDVFFHEENIGTTPLAVIVFLIELAILGGLAGLFLMVSSMSHMISMYKHLESGKSIASLASRQILRGLILLLFAMMMEAVIGNYGILGRIFQHLDGISAVQYDIWRYRFVHMETIHTIAWCMILNGIVQALLSIKNNWKRYTLMMVLYGALALIVLALTPIIWQWINTILPGYPYSQRTIITPDGNPRNIRIMYPYIGFDSIWYIIRSVSFAPLAGYPEPIFPYLAASFLGSIIGIYLSKPRKQKSWKQMRVLVWIGIVMFVIGTVGLLGNFYVLLDTAGFDPVYKLFRKIYDHRLYTSIGTQDYGGGVISPPYVGWLFQFLAFNGLSMIVILLMVRLVEFRGISEKLAKNSKFIRRFGFIAFTLYTMQWIYFIIFFLITKYLIPAVTVTAIEPYDLLSWYWTLAVLAITLLFFYGLTLLWEKIDYVGSLEWWMAMIGFLVLPGVLKTFLEKKKKGEFTKSWWKPLSVQQTFYNAEWISFDEINKEQELDTIHREEARLSSILGWAGLIFFPFSCISLAITVKSLRTKKKSGKEIYQIVLACLGIVLGITTIIVLSLLNLEVLGLDSLLS
ncbi:MAG: hypothetical protein JW776_04690 [Candidatus Lokiarchaeota archaeon]|nr:hypothetical protein [Candidatus Lokiarchaeota archaeon]